MEERRKDESMGKQRDISCVRMIGGVEVVLTYQMSTCGDINELMILCNSGFYSR